MNDEALARLERTEHFARHVSEAMTAVATLLDDPDPGALDFTRVPEMFNGCPDCTVEALLYLAVRIFDNAHWNAARLRREIPTVVGQVLGTEIR